MTDKDLDVLFNLAKEKLSKATHKKCTRLIILNNIHHYIKTVPKKKKFEDNLLREFTKEEKEFIIQEKI